VNAHELSYLVVGSLSDLLHPLDNQLLLVRLRHGSLEGISNNRYANALEVDDIYFSRGVPSWLGANHPSRLLWEYKGIVAGLSMTTDLDRDAAIQSRKGDGICSVVGPLQRGFASRSLNER
jgi:hypothetical protein